ncbi:MAG: EAL domain-containing protein [Candidatus Contendobacter sp.]|nr:EAL domain-containing protein [Candidatus Contendobacter sp.]MDS4058744.1 EAL domain-containing protein [Candidatus Contendobacter sp.]
MKVQPLRRWLVLRIGWVAVLLLAIIAVLAWLFLVPQIRSDLAVRQQTLARAVSGQIETYLRGVRHQLDAVARMRQNLGYRPSPFWFDLLDSHVGTDKVFQAIYLVNAADLVHSVGLPEAQRGRRQDLIGLDLSRWDFLRQARENQKPAWSEVFLSAITSQLAVALAIPADDQMIVGEIAIEPLATLLSDLPGQSKLAAMIFDHRGQIIAHSEQTLNGQQINLSYLPIVCEALQGHFMTRNFLFEREPLVGTTIGVSLVEWIVLIAQSQYEASRPTITLLEVTASVLGLTLLLATVISWVLARKFSRHFARHAKQARAIADGDYSNHPQMISQIAEFVDLDNDLQRMAFAIQHREQALTASEARFRDLLAMASDWFWEQDEHFRFTFISSENVKLGLDQRETAPITLLGKTRWEMPTNLTAGQWATHQAMLEAHQAFRDFEYRLQLADGKELWSSVNGRPLFDSSNRFIGYRGTGRNITERKRAEARQRLAAVVLEAARDAIIVIDSDTAWKIIAVNPAFTALTGYTEAEARGRSARMLWAERQPEDYFETIIQILAREGMWQGELRIRRKDGEHRIVLASVGTVRDSEGRTTRYVGIATDTTALKAAEQRIERLAYYDPLTNLPNRVLLAQRAELALALARRRDEGVAVLLLDLDRFKEVNDSLGHTEGDTLLVQVAARLQGLTRAEDTACRLGGDEFVLLLPATDQGGALQVAEKVLAACHQPFEVCGHQLRETVSIGVALYPHDGASFAELLKNADAALHRAKHEGRNTRVFYDRAMNDALFERLLLESDLRQALADGQLRAYYQPKVQLADGTLIGAEALVRWQHPVRGLLAPGQFVPVAEASDLIVALGDWMLAEVCSQLAAWRQQGWPPLPVAINLAARHFRRLDLVDRISNLLATYNLPASALELELTESTLLETGSQTTDTLRTLHQLGVGLAIDDFGTGYSSLSYLKRLPLTALKIDRSFVRDLVTDPDDRIFAATIVALGHQLNLEVVAEGVETEDQRRILLDQDCDLAQGYLFGFPMPSNAFANWRTDHLKTACLDTGESTPTRQNRYP